MDIRSLDFVHANKVIESRYSSWDRIGCDRRRFLVKTFHCTYIICLFSCSHCTPDGSSLKLARVEVQRFRFRSMYHSFLLIVVVQAACLLTLAWSSGIAAPSTVATARNPRSHSKRALDLLLVNPIARYFVRVLDCRLGLKAGGLLRAM